MVKTLPRLAFIHGLNSSYRSFAFLVHQLELSRPILINYNSHGRVENSINDILKFLPKNEELILIGHSLGGLIAALITTRKLVNVSRLVTISAPIAGSKIAGYARWIASIPSLNDIAPNAPVIRELISSEITVPTLSIVSAGGGLPGAPNDGIISVASQKAIRNAKHLEIKANHFEIMMHEQMHEAIRHFCLSPILSSQ
jgi:pimeloyl-ACP methyl ester carboxylesterase